MDITNNIRYSLSVILLTLAYISVVLGSILMHLTDVVAGTSFEQTSLSDWWALYSKELELIKVSLL